MNVRVIRMIVRVIRMIVRVIRMIVRVIRSPELYGHQSCEVLFLGF